MSEAATKPDRTLIVILSIIAALVVVALVVVFARGEPKLLDPATPQGVVQRYAAAVIAGDDSTAAAYLTRTALATCDGLEHPATDNLRVALVSTTERAGSADVKVSLISSSESGPFGVSENESEDAFQLRLVNEEWLIDRAPYQLSVCPKARMTP